MAIERSRKTGLPAVRAEVDKDTKIVDYLDCGTVLKKARSKKGGATLTVCSKSFGREVTTDDIAMDINELTDRNGWIAIIHADGNGLGAILATNGGDKEKLHNFSTNLSFATKTVA